MSQSIIEYEKLSQVIEDCQRIVNFKLTNLIGTKVKGNIVFPESSEKSGDFELNPGESKVMAVKSPNSISDEWPEIIVTDPLVQG